jgi:hypothetical protein
MSSEVDPELTVETPVLDTQTTGDTEGRSAVEVAAAPRGKANRQCELCTFYGPCRRSHLTEVDGGTIYRNCCEACNEINRAMVLSRSTCGIKDREEYVEKLREINDRYAARVRRYNESGEGKVYWEYVKNPDPFVRRPARPTTARPGQAPPRQKKIEILNGEYDSGASAEQSSSPGGGDQAPREAVAESSDPLDIQRREVMGTRYSTPAVIEVPLFCICGNEFMEDSYFCRKCGVKRHDVAAKATSSASLIRSAPPQEKCVCGNLLLQDSVFCRKCGVRRPAVTVEVPKAKCVEALAPPQREGYPARYEADDNTVVQVGLGERRDYLAGNLERGRPSLVPVST